MIGHLLVACEFSGTVRDAFALHGWDAWSCDLQPSSGQHLQGDVRTFLSRHWDMIVAHPPCTCLAFSGARWLRTQCDTRYEEFLQAVEFFNLFLNLSCPHICVENPRPHKQALEFIPAKTQIIQPWQFGDEAQKETWLWLKGLPKLKPTKLVSKGEFRYFESGKRMPAWQADGWNLSDEERRNFRSKTFQGIADAMADQWTKHYLSLHVPNP